MKSSKIEVTGQELNPSSRNFTGIVGEARKIFEWRWDLGSFFEAVTGNKPYPYQKEFLDKMADLTNQYAIISAGRGTGKTESLAILALWYVYVLPLTTPGTPMKVVVLAGSEKQAKICYGYICSYIAKIPFLQKALAKPPTNEEILFLDGSWIKPLTASEKSVRGPHPDMLIIDEACQASNDLLTAAMPMIGTSAFPRLILSSTPDKFYSLFVDIYAKDKDFPQFLRYNWSAENCPQISKGFLNSQKTLVDSGNYMIEYLGVPYSFSGKVFPLKQLKECVKWRGLTDSGEAKYAGVDWGFFPAPTVISVVEEFIEKGVKKYKLLHAEPYLKQNFEDVLDKIETIARSYTVSKIYTDSNDIGENQRLTARGLPVVPVKFKSAKPLMISNLRALIENENIMIDGAKDYPVVAQLRDYRYDSKKGDDFVDSLMLAVNRSNVTTVPSKWSLKDFIVVTKRKVPSLNPRGSIQHQMDPRHMKPDELVTKKERELWSEVKRKNREERNK